MDRRPVTLGLDTLWLEFRIALGLLIFEGVRRAPFDEAEGSRESVGESDDVEGCRNLETGRSGRADVGGGATGRSAALTAIVARL